jgi:hypothetical protein
MHTPKPRDEPVGFLEPGQLRERLNQPVPRAVLSPGVRAALWGLRILVLAASVMVIYSFITQLS